MAKFEQFEFKLNEESGKEFEERPEKAPAKEEIPKEERERFIKNQKPFLETLGKRKISLVLERSDREETLSFDHKRGAVNVNLGFLERTGLSFDQIEFCLSHEIGHLIQLSKDPQGYLKIFDFVESRAKEKAELPEKERPAEEKVLTKIYHDFFNVLLDINANQTIIEQIVPYHPREGTKSEAPRKLYKENLFPAEQGKEIPDYSKSPLYGQFLQYILRKNMTGEPALVSEEVKEVIERKLSAFGEKFKPEEFIRECLQPSEIKAGEILFLAERFLLPIFEELIEKDRKAGRLTPIEIIKIIDGKDSQQTSEEYKKAAKKILEDEKEARKSSRERQKEFSRIQFQKMLKEAGFTKREVKELTEIRESCEEEVKKLSQVWHSFARILQEVTLVKERRHKTGIKVNIRDVIPQWPKIQQEPEKAEVMEKYIPTIKESLLPKKIKIALCLDLSGSMTDEKRQEVKKIVYTVCQSLNRFKSEVSVQFPEEEEVIGSVQFPEEEEVIGVEPHLIAFGSEAEELPFEKTGEETIDFYRAILDISNNLGGTEDAKALVLANEKFREDDLAGIKKGEILGTILEITDGETQTASASRQIIEEINKKEVFCRGIQIPGDIINELSPEDEEKRRREGKFMPELIPPSGTFLEVWQEKGLRIDNLTQLKDIILKLLEEALETSYKEE